jgi:hypothetical protein
MPTTKNQKPVNSHKTATGIFLELLVLKNKSFFAKKVNKVSNARYPRPTSQNKYNEHYHVDSCLGPDDNAQSDKYFHNPTDNGKNEQ